VDDVLALHPCFNFHHFQTRVHSMFSWSLETEAYEHVAGNSTLPSMSMPREPTLAKPTLSFFAAASAAFALGSLVQRTDDNRSASLEGDGPPLSDPYLLPDNDLSTSPAALFALSEQALAIFEKSYNYDLDYMVATILQVIYLLHDGRSRLPHTILPLVSLPNTSHIDDNLHTFRSEKW